MTKPQKMPLAVLAPKQVEACLKILRYLLGCDNCNLQDIVRQTGLRRDEVRVLLKIMEQEGLVRPQTLWIQ